VPAAAAAVSGEASVTVGEEMLLCLSR
jgi:hypothetical protein